MKALRILGKILSGLLLLAGILTVILIISLLLVAGWNFLADITGPTADAVVLFVGRVLFIAAIIGTLGFYAYEIGDSFFNWLDGKRLNRQYRKAGML